MEQTILRVAAFIGAYGTIAAVVINSIKSFHQLRDGMRCILRAEMMHTYYKHHDKDELREYEIANFEMEYAAYKALGGNSFMDKIHDDVMKWEVLP